MQATIISPRKLTDERGGVLVTVLIVATLFAILAYITLQVSIQSLESTDTHANIYMADLVSEGGVETGAAMLRQDFSGLDIEPPYYLEPAYALSTSEESLRAELLSSENVTTRVLNTMPEVREHTAYTFQHDTESVSTYQPDTNLIPGDRDNAEYTFTDDDSWSQDYPGIEFEPNQSTGDMVLFSFGEVIERDGDLALFSFNRAEYPSVEWHFDYREAGVTEPSRIGPYPYIQSEHPYGPNQSRGWTVTYMQDPLHPGRQIKDMALVAGLDEVEIDLNDRLFLSGWNDDERRFDPPSQVIENYRNSADRVFSNTIDSHTIGMFLYSDAGTVDPTLDNGFRVSGVRYGFDSDENPALYETPHPYDDIIPPLGGSDYNVQVIYSPFQASGAAPAPSPPQMRIKFNHRFDLDVNDRLYLFNANDPFGPPVEIYSFASPPPLDGWTTPISVNNPALPLGYVMILQRGLVADLTPNYGYKVVGMEYTDQFTNVGDPWIYVDDPIMESPHNIYLGPNDLPVSFAGVLPLANNYLGYQTIYRPFCPNVDINSGVGTVDEWFIEFSEGCDLTATSLGTNNDYIRLTTPGNILAANGADTLYFINPSSNLGPMLIANPDQYFDVVELKGAEFSCGTSPYMQVEFYSDVIDEFEPSVINWGFRVDKISYTTTDGADLDNSNPTIRTDSDFPNNTSYPAYGSSAMQYSEWWYSNPNALVVGLHFDRYHFELDPGDRIEIRDEAGLLLATLSSESVTSQPDAGDPENPSGPDGGEQSGGDPDAGGPNIFTDEYADTFVNLDETYGWVLIPGTAAQVLLLGDGDINDGFAGFEIDHCGYVNGEITEIKVYVEEYAALAYDQYYDRTSEALEAFRTLGMD